MKINVLALFDDGNQSVYNSLPKDKYNVVSVGIQEKDTVVKMDLSLDIRTCIIEIKNYMKEHKILKWDVICASPMCNAFSRMSARPFSIKGNGTFRHDLTLREKWEYDEINKFVQSNQLMNFEKQNAMGELGITLLANTMQIIQFFKPEHWYIENPAKSLMWEYIEKKAPVISGINNIANYAEYGGVAQKKTNFLSNIDLGLIDSTKRGEKLLEQVSGNDRSKIPTKLIIDIFNKFIDEKDRYEPLESNKNKSVIETIEKIVALNEKTIENKSNCDCTKVLAKANIEALLTLKKVMEVK